MSFYDVAAVSIPPNLLTFSNLCLPSKPHAPIEYTFTPCSTQGPLRGALVVFLNGLIVPQVTWFPVVAMLHQRRAHLPAMMTYDRFGQGRTTARDPLDALNVAGDGHDVNDVVEDLQALISEVWRKHVSSTAFPEMVLFVASSIGCPIARLFAQQYPGTVANIVMLDSNMANCDFVDDMWPNPDHPAFDSSKALPEGVTVDDLRTVRTKYGAMFHPSVKNPERLNRKNLKDLLPFADRPQLVGPNGKGPRVVVVGHDPGIFASESNRSLSTPVELTLMYSQPKWDEYNEGLVRITDVGLAKGPIIAPKCSHFIPRDDPRFVASIVAEELDGLS